MMKTRTRRADMKLKELGEWNYIADGKYPDTNKTILACTKGGSFLILKDYLKDGHLRNIWTGNVFANRSVFTGKIDNFENMEAWVYLEEDENLTVQARDGSYVKEKDVLEYNKHCYDEDYEED
jgi:hypothetical protein